MKLYNIATDQIEDKKVVLINGVNIIVDKVSEQVLNNGGYYIEATITGNIVFPAATGFVEAYYTHNGTITKTITESVLDSLTGTLSEVRKYNSALSTEQQLIIGYTA